jgi:hypothetical protein
VTKPVAVGAVTVTLSATADTPVAGTPPRPVTARVTEVVGPFGAPSALRVSSSRAGVRPVKEPPGAVVRTVPGAATAAPVPAAVCAATETV